MSYDDSFYDEIRRGTIRSAGVIVPLLRSWFLEGIDDPTVVDVGCGQGWWAAEFQSEGVTATGIDGGYVEPVIDDFHQRDLALEIGWTGKPFDLALCLEVAEHLPEARAGSLVAELCALAPVVVFSAAIPGQGGTDHVNEQKLSWWEHLFRERDFSWIDVRASIWEDERVEPWYRQNLAAFVRAGRRYNTPPVQFPVLDVVHPTVFNWYAFGEWPT
jgi:SAM-dependent methyltransferase